ncbi:MAG: hypothetical protein ACI4OS_03165, partial [Akkermansia sp.]
MKLHLPSRLRAALLACMAVVSPVVMTIASGVLTGSALVASLTPAAHAGWNTDMTEYTYDTTAAAAATTLSSIDSTTGRADSYTIVFTATPTVTSNLLTFDPGSDFSFTVATPTINDDGTVSMTSNGNTNSAYTGNITILSGTTLKLTGATDASQLGVLYKDNKNRYITVQSGATLDTGGMDTYYHVKLEAGAVLTNYTAAMLDSHKCLPALTLLGNAAIDNGSRIVMQKADADSGAAENFKLDLAGYTLTKKGTGGLWLKKIQISGGTIKLEQGDITFNANCSVLGELVILAQSEVSTSIGMSGISSVAGATADTTGSLTIDANSNITV